MVNASGEPNGTAVLQGEPNQAAEMSQNNLPKSIKEDLEEFDQIDIKSSAPEQSLTAVPAIPDPIEWLENAAQNDPKSYQLLLLLWKQEIALRKDKLKLSAGVAGWSQTFLTGKRNLENENRQLKRIFADL